MSRIMYDAASPSGIPWLPSYKDVLIGMYVTGTPGANWAGKLGSFPGAEFVSIDQHGFGEHDYRANVIDVEPGCWSVNEVSSRMRMSSAPRPTVYCDRNDYPGVRDVWKGDVWLAAPGGVNLASYPGAVAVQEQFNGDYDVSVIYDPWWPLLPPPVTRGLTVTTDDKGHATIAWSGQAGATEYSVLVKGTGGAGTGTSYIHDVTNASPVTLSLAPGSYAVSVTPLYPQGNVLTAPVVIKG